MSKFKKVVILDSVVLYPEHRVILNQISDEVLEYPSSLPENLDKQYTEHPELFKNIKCYTEIPANNHSLQLLMNRVEGADVVVSCWTNIPDEILRTNPQLKLIVFWTHEKEHRINMKLADELGIKVANIPDYGTDSVTEAVFAGFWELLKRNHGKANVPTTESEIAHSVMSETFSFFRQMETNEKNTRSGKFTHHFHKLGMVKWDFDEKTLEEMIPERLVEHKHVGLLNIANGKEAVIALKTLGVIIQEFTITDSNLAEYYKFIATNEIIFFDSKNISEKELLKLKAMANVKLIDVQALVTSDYFIQNKVFGIVGLGRIGQKVAGIAKQLGFKVIYYSKNRNEKVEKELGVEYKDLKELAAISDVVSVHLPAHKAENLLNADIINALKNKSIFINTADGNAIDQTALTQRMLNGEIFAYLDVYPGLPRKDILGIPMDEKSDWKLHKVLANNVLAYRVGWKTQESIRVKTYKLLGEMFHCL